MHVEGFLRIYRNLLSMYRALFRMYRALLQYLVDLGHHQAAATCRSALHDLVVYPDLKRVYIHFYLSALCSSPSMCQKRPRHMKRDLHIYLHIYQLHMRINDRRIHVYIHVYHNTLYVHICVVCCDRFVYIHVYVYIYMCIVLYI